MECRISAPHAGIVGDDPDGPPQRRRLVAAVGLAGRRGADAALYVHEVGHTLAALRSGVPVLRAPLFLPGVGAVAPLGPLVAVGDTVVVALAGPLLGGAAALLV